MPDSNLGPRWRHIAAVVRGEAANYRAARKMLQMLLSYSASALGASGYDPAVLDVRAARSYPPALAALLGETEVVFLQSWGRAARVEVDPEAYAVRHLEAVTNRLAGVPDEVFDAMRVAIVAGRAEQEGIPELSARIETLLGDEQRWQGRATMIARTETIGAANAGARGAAAASAQVMGYAEGDVVKEWVSTADSRTRETHLEAEGQQVVGMDTPFTVGGAELDVPGDPFGPPEETVNCRCAVVFYFPGDPGYPTDGVSSASSANNIPAPVNPLSAVPDTAAPAAPAEPVEPVEAAVDPGPQTDQERMARAATLDELIMETKRGSAGAKAVARAELVRRGFPGVASGRIKAALTAGQEHTMTDALTAGGESEDGEQYGVVVVALPAADDPVHGIGPEDKHATLLYYGDVEGGDNPNAGLTDDFRTLLSQAVAQVASDQEPRTGQVNGVEELGDGGAHVWMLDGPPLTDLRDALLDAGVSEVAEVLGGVEQYPTFTPHVTIGYTDNPEQGDGDGTTVTPEQLDAAAAVESITFDRLAIWWAGEQTEWPLGGTEQEEQDMDETTDSVAAALADPAVRAAYAREFGIAAAEGDEQEAPPSPDAASDIAPDGDPFYGIIWPENVQSGDARGVAAGATTWRDLPLPLMFQEATQMGHDGAARVGRIDTLTRDETTYSVPVIRYTGVWDSSAYAVEMKRQVEEGMVRGVSVDGDAVTVELRDSSGNPLDPMVDDFPEDGVVVEVATAARISGATGCSIPAFHQAYIANGRLEDRTDPEPGWNADGTPKDNTLTGPTEQGDEAEAVAASAGTAACAPAWSLVAAAAPVWAAADFQNPGLTEPTRLTITDDGRVYGHLATWGVCHIGIDGVCQEAPASATNYAYFATGSVQLDDGNYMPVGQLTMETGHAAMNLRHRAAVAHYDNTGTAVADVAMGQDGVGIWMAGRLRPGTTPEQVYAMRAAGSVSGDWREVGGGLELVAALVVNVPGFPIPAPAVTASGPRATALIASGVVRPTDAAPAEGLLTFADVRREALAVMDRRDRAAVAAARLRAGRAATASRRLQAQAQAARADRVAAAAARLMEV